MFPRFLLILSCFLFSIMNQCWSPDKQIITLSEEEIDTYIAKGEELAEHYTSPEFLDPIINADKIRFQKQQEFNHKLIYDFNIPNKYSTTNIGIYNADLMRIAALGTYWGIELCLFHMLHKAFAQMHITHIINHKKQILELLEKIKLQSSSNTEQNKNYNEKLYPLLTKPTLWGGISPINKKIVLLFFTYTLSTNTLRRTENRFLLNDFNTYPTNKDSGKPSPISSLIPTQWAKAGHTSYFSTYSLTTFINSIFKKMNLLPTWSERFDVEIIKEMLVLIFFTMWYEKKIIRKSWISYSMKHPDKLKNLLKNFNPKEKTNHLLEAFLKNTQISFKTWVLCKTIQTGLWNTIVNLIISIPAWYKVGKFFHQTYRNIWPSQKQESSS